MRHTGKWETVFFPESAEEACTLIREHPLFRPEPASYPDPKEDLEEMKRAIEEDCERIDSDGW